MAAREGFSGIADIVSTAQEILRNLEGARSEGVDPLSVINLDGINGSQEEQQQGNEEQEQFQDSGNGQQQTGWQQPQQPETPAREEPVHKIEPSSSPGSSTTANLSPVERAKEIARRSKQIKEEREQEEQEKANAVKAWDNINLEEAALKMAYDKYNDNLTNTPLLPMTEEEATERRRQNFNSLNSLTQDALRTLGADPNSLREREAADAMSQQRESEETSKAAFKERKKKISNATKIQNKEVKDNVISDLTNTIRRFSGESKEKEIRSIVSEVNKLSNSSGRKGAENIAKAVNAATGNQLSKDEVSQITDRLTVISGTNRNITKSGEKKINQVITYIRSVVSEDVDEKDVRKLIAQIRNLIYSKNKNDEIKQIIINVEKLSNGKAEEKDLKNLSKILKQISKSKKNDKVNNEPRRTIDDFDSMFIVDPSGATVQSEIPDDIDLITYEKRYRIPDKILKKKKMSDDKKIETAMRDESDKLLSSFFRNRANIEVPSSTTEEFDEDFRAGRTEIGRYDTGLSDRQRADIEAIQKQLEFIGDCYIPTEGQHIDENGNIRQSSRVETAINEYMNHMRLAPYERWLVHFQVGKRLGYSCDRNGKYLLQDYNKIPDELFIQALKDLERGAKLHKNPYHLFSHNIKNKYGGTRCFPIGVMSLEEAKILCRDGGPLSNMDPLQAMSKARNEFVNVTMKEIRRDAHKKDDGGIAQLMVINDYVRALCSLDDISPRLFDVAEATDRGFEELLWECDPISNPNADPEVLAKREEQLLKSEQRLNKRRYKLDRLRNRTSSVYKEDVIDPETGEILFKRGDRIDPKTYIRGSVSKELRSSKVAPLDAFCTFTTNMAKFMGVIGFSPVIAGGYVEHFAGNINSSITNKILAKTFSMYAGNDGDTYRVNDALYHAASTDEFVDGIKAWKVLLRTGGQDAVALFYEGERYGDLTVENARKFLDDCVNKQSVFNGDKIQTVKKIAGKASEALELLLPGDIGFGKKDARRWMEGFMLNNQINANRSDGNAERAFTASEVNEMIDSMGATGFLAAATSTNAGRDAAVMMRYSTLARESPITHIVDNCFRRFGLINLFVTMGIDTYFVYGLNMVQGMIPFSSTVSYLMVRGINFASTGGINNQERDNLEILEYQLGGLDSFGTGLVKNLMYDGIKTFNVAISGCIIAVILMMIGFDEPEDPGLKYRWDEYIIGKKIGLGGFDENGEPQGIPIYRAWWLDDLTLFGLPLAYALCVKNVNQKLGDNDPDLPRQIFMDGCYDVISGTSLFDLMRSMKNAEQVVMDFDDLMTDPNKRLKTDWISYAYMNFFELPLARTANKLFVPNALRDAMRDEYEHSAYTIYDRDSTIPGATTNVKTWEDLQRRIESRYNPVYAIWNNWWQNGYIFDKGDTNKTGYLYSEMPLAFEPDARRTSFLEIKLNYTPLNQIPEDEKADRVEEMCDKLYDLIKNEYDWDVDRARADGFTMPMDLRFEFDSYLLRRQNYVINVYEQAKLDGVRGNELTEMKLEKNRLYDEYKQMLDDWCWNTAKIPWTDKGYVRLRTEYETVYYRKSNNKPVSETTYILEGPSDIEKRYVPKGNTPNNFALFTSPETQNRGFNYETIAEWYDENLSDLEKIFNEQAGIDPNKPISEQPGKFAKYGYSKNVPLNSSMFGGNYSFPTNVPMESDVYLAMNEPTAGRRALVPFEESMLWDLPNFNGKIEKDENGNDKTVNKNIPDNTVKSQLKNLTRQNVDPGNLGELGKYIDWDSQQANSTYPYYPSYSYGSRGSGGYSYGGGSRSSGSSYNPKIYSTHVSSTNISSTRISNTRTNPDARSVNNDRAATMYSKSPQDTRINSYLRPSFETKGSREAYKRQDI